MNIIIGLGFGEGSTTKLVLGLSGYGGLWMIMHEASYQSGNEMIEKHGPKGKKNG